LERQTRFLRPVGGGETAINNGMITRQSKDDRHSGLVLECLLASKCRVGRMQLFVDNRRAILGDRENGALRYR
jgi:hypothetical protein